MLLLLATMAVLCLGGCGGCDKQPADGANAKKDAADENKSALELEEERRKKLQEQKKKKPELEIGPLVPKLSPRIVADEEVIGLPAEEEKAADRPRRFVKPGHWTSTVQSMKANYEDFVGRTEAFLIDPKDRPVPIADTPFTLTSTRPVVLAKGREKMVEGELLIPVEADTPKIHSALFRRGAYRADEAKTFPMAAMPSYQYFLVVVAKEPARYGYLQVADAIRAPWEDDDGSPNERHYQVLVADTDGPFPLSAGALTWTSLAYLVWDEVDPAQLEPDVQQSLVDWLHWGGRLVVNGPDSLDLLKGSFLESYLPAENDGSQNVTADALRPWNDYWSEPSEGRALEPLTPSSPWSAVRLKPHDDAVELPGTAGLFYERAVGYGSVVVSGVQLAQRDLVNWPGFDSFLNAVVLRRPPRQFTTGPYGGLKVGWAGENSPYSHDAHFMTPLRYFARDWRASANWLRVTQEEPNGVMSFTDDYEPFRIAVDRPGGIASWSEFSPVSSAAREVLREAAGVRVPSASFVLVCLAVYLLVLVPLNWMVFRTLRRVEWAWLTAPVIAVLGTLMVVHLAQLDIGFVRSQTEIAVLELQGDYPRGHLSRYTALYASLATTYDLAFDDPSAVATPFPARKDDQTIKQMTPRPVNFVKHKDTRLEGLTISSASTRLVHSEQMLELEGPLWLGKSSQGLEQVVNRTGLHLSDVMVLQRYIDRSGKPQIKGCWLGPLRSGQSAVLGLRPLTVGEEQLPFATERKQAAETAVDERLNLNPLVKLALEMKDPKDPRWSERDEYRLIARIDQLLPGTEVSPAASQTQGATLVVAHLKNHPLPLPEPDVNSREDVTKVQGR